MFKVEVQVFGDDKWYSNALEFVDPEEAKRYGADLFSRWTQTTAWRVVQIVEGECHVATGEAA